MTTDQCIFEGELGEIQVPDVLTFLDMLGKTGTLEVSHGEDRRRIYWDRGEVVFADSTVVDEHLPEYLVRNGWVMPEALAEARRNAASDAAVIKTLIRDGALDPPMLPKAVRNLVFDIVYTVFEWKDGRFRFLLTPEPHPEKLSLKASVSNTIVEGCRRLDEWQRIREVFPSEAHFPYPTGSDDPAGMKLATVELEILGFVDGRRSISDVIRAVPHDQFTVLNALLTLQSCGLIGVSAEKVEPRTTETAAPAEGVNAEASEIVRAFNNIFAGIHARVAEVKGDEGRQRYASTLEKESFQTSDVFQGVRFSAQGTLPESTMLANLSSVAAAERISRLRGSLDRLLAQQVRQMDTSYTDADRKAINELISREKGRLASV